MADSKPSPAPSDQETLPPPGGLEDAADQSPSELPEVPGYEILGELGRGGMGVVYRATDTVLEREVAVKVLQEGFDPDSDVARRFLDEARITGQLQHPGIPAVHDLGTLPDGRPFLAMKLVKGRTLDALLGDRPDPSVERGQYLAVFEQICQAVGYAHAHDVIHRDLKPANVMVGAFGEVQVMDWGLAKVLRSGAAPEPEARPKAVVAPTVVRSRRDTDGSETQAGSVMGTPAYMPPEQAAGDTDKVDRRSDVFGLGAILCTMLTGKPPFEGQGPASVRLNAVRGRTEQAFARLDACRAEPDVVALCKRCLAFEPADRPENAEVLAREIARLRGQAEQRARDAELERARVEVKTGEQRKRRRVLTLAGGTLIAVLVVGIVATAWQANRAEGERSRAVAAEEEANRRSAEADEQRKKAQERLEKAVEVVDQMMLRAAGERWARRPELREERKRVLLEAVAFFRGLTEEESRDPRVRRETVNANMRAGGALVSLGDRDGALQHLTRAVELQRGVVRDAPGDLDAVTLLAHLLNLRAGTFLLLARYADVETVSREAIEVARRAVTASGTGPAAREGSPEAVLCECLSAYANFNSKRDPAESGRLHEESLTTARRLADRGDRSFSVRLSLGIGLTNRAAADVARNRFREADESFTEAERLLAELTSEEPPTARLADHRDAARIQLLTNRATLLSRTNQPLRAVEKSREALAVADDMLTFQPGYFPWMYQRLATLIQIAEGLRRAGRAGEALKVLPEIDAAEQSLLTAYPEHTWVPGQSAVLRSTLLVEKARDGGLETLREDFDALQKKSPPGPALVVRYNRACAFSWASVKAPHGEREAWAREAVRTLEQLRDDGYFQSPRAVAQLDGDPDLTPLREREDYQRFHASLPKP